MKVILALLAAALLAGNAANALPADVASAPPKLPERESEIVPNSYLVLFKPDADAGAAMREVKQAMVRENAREGNGGVRSAVTREYTRLPGFKGLAGTMTARLAEELARNPAVELVEPDHVARAVAEQQNPPSWGLPRSSQRDRDLSKPYVYPDSAGKGATVYIVDTGIAINHLDFEGRAKWGKTTCDDCPNEDDHGHGTHVAGTAAGAKYGLAKKADLVAVKVLNGGGSGSYAGVIAGVEWVGSEAKRLGKTVVGNMSLGGPHNRVLDEAVNAAFKAGAVFVVAAGNAEDDACSYSPAGAGDAITVAATTDSDGRASFSNYGKCVDIFAPGAGITSAWNDGGQRTISGTSMASPHVAGAVALLLSQSPASSPAEITQKLDAAATPDKVGNPSDAPNKLLYVGYA